MFRLPRPSPSISAQSTDGCPKTLDVEHNSALNRMHINRAVLKDLKAEIAALNTSIDGLTQLRRSLLTEEQNMALLNMFDSRDSLMKKSEEIEAKCDDVAYFMKTADVLFKYYEVVDNGNRSAQRCDAQPTSSSPSANSSKSILNWFASAPPSAAASSNVDAPCDIDTADIRPRPAATNVVNTEDRATLLDKYLRCIEDDSAVTPSTSSGQPSGESHIHQDMCHHCKSSDRTVLLQDGYVFCNKCYTVEYILVDHDRPSYKDPPRETTFFAYKRINHFNEWLSQCQGKETTDIPDDVYDAILLEIKKQKICNMATLTRKKIKEILKKLRINKYYEHCNQIISRINGIPSPHLPPDLEERLRHMFCQIQVPFIKHAPAQRKNFLSYSYVLHKMMQLLEHDEYLDSFTLLKSRDKLHQQDVIWSKICIELGWTFYPSL